MGGLSLKLYVNSFHSGYNFEFFSKKYSPDCEKSAYNNDIKKIFKKPYDILLFK